MNGILTASNASRSATLGVRERPAGLNRINATLARRSQVDPADQLRLRVALERRQPMAGLGRQLRHALVDLLSSARARKPRARVTAQQVRVQDPFEQQQVRPRATTAMRNRSRV